MGGGINPDALMALGSASGNPEFALNQMPPRPNMDISAAGKDQSRLVNLDTISQLPDRSPFRSAGDPNQPQAVRTETYTPQSAPNMFADTMSKPRTDTVQGVPMEGGIMTKKPTMFGDTGDAMPMPEHSSSPVPQATTNMSPAPAPSLFDTSAPKPPATAQGAGLFGLKIPGMDSIQSSLKAAPTNPLFQVGMGLAQGGYDGSNPYAHITKNLSGIQPQELAGRKAQDEAGDAELRALIAKMMMSQGTGGGATPPKGVMQSQGAARLVR